MLLSARSFVIIAGAQKTASQPFGIWSTANLRNDVALGFCGARSRTGAHWEQHRAV